MDFVRDFIVCQRTLIIDKKIRQQVFKNYTACQAVRSKRLCKHFHCDPCNIPTPLTCQKRQRKKKKRKCCTLSITGKVIIKTSNSNGVRSRTSRTSTSFLFQIYARRITIKRLIWNKNVLAQESKAKVRTFCKTMIVTDDVLSILYSDLMCVWCRLMVLLCQWLRDNCLIVSLFVSCAK